MPSRRAHSVRARLAAVLATACLLALTLSVGQAVAVPAPAQADDTCAANQFCSVTIDGVAYVVLGPCDISSTASITSGCLIIDSTPVGGGGGGGSLLVCGSHGCGPTVISQETLGATPLEQYAKSTIASLRGIANDQLNTYWSRDEIRALMYLRLLAITNETPGSRTSDDQQAVTFYQNLVNDERVAVAKEAMSLYQSWAGNPCGFQLPVGDPNAYLDEPDVAGSISGACNIPPNSPACLLGACTPAPPPAEEFTGWAEDAVLQSEVNGWGSGLQEQDPGLHLTDAQAQNAALFEFDSAMGGINEGVGYLTAQHAEVGDIPEATQSEAESDLQEQWLDGLHDFAGDQFRDVVKSSIQSVFQAFDEAESDGFASELEQGLAAALEEDAAGAIAESWDTVVGPAIAAAAVIAFETWQQINNTQVPVNLQASLDDANAGHDLAYYAGDTDGRALILAALVKSTMPDYSVDRITDPTYGSAPAAGPAAATDPIFNTANPANPAGTAGNSFLTYDWDHQGVASTSVRNGWFVQTRDNGPQRYTPDIDYLEGGGTTSCAPDSCTVTLGVYERWRTWLDGSNFLSERIGVEDGDANVNEGVNAGCGSSGFLLPSGNVDLGEVCVYPAGTSFPFAVATGDQVEIGGQVRPVGAVQSDGNGHVTSFEVTAPFGDPVPSGSPMLVLTHVDGNCLTQSSLGNRVAGPDCVVSPTINLVQGTSVTLVQRHALAITASSVTVQPGDPTPTITPSYSGFAGSDSPASLTTAPTCSTSYSPSVGPGTYATSCSGAVDPSYVITYVGGSITVPSRPMTITAPSLTLNYGAAVPTLTPTFAGEPGGSLLVQPTCTTTYTPTSPPGPYSTSCSGANAPISDFSCSGDLNDPNLTCTGGEPLYPISYVSGSITVQSVALTIRASSPLVTYGDAVPAITPSYSGFLPGDSAASLTSQPTCTTTYTKGAAPGGYPSSCTGAVSSTYTISYVAGLVTAAPAHLTVTASSPVITYGDPVPAISPSYAGFANGDTPASLILKPTCTTLYTQGAAVAGYVSACVGAVDGNYAITYVNGSVAVGRAPLTVTAANAAMVQRAKLPTLSGAVSGLKGTDKITATYATTATSASPVGTYAITPTLHDPGNRLSNYTVSIVPGTLTISYVATGSSCVIEAGHTILAPIDAKGKSVFKVGTIVIARFRVCDATGKSIGSAGVVKSFALVQTIHGSTTTNVNQAVASATSAKAFTWDPILREWEFAISTKALAKGTTYVYLITLNDGSTISFRYTTS